MFGLRAFLVSAFAAVAALAAPMAWAGDVEGVSKIELRPGWRMADGGHMAALRIVLEPGWKTYWRAPGDVGIPPRFDWSGSTNLSSLSTLWPTPDVFFEQGSRSVGYKNEVIIPLQIRENHRGKAIGLTGHMQIGVCKDICLPANFTFQATLPAGRTKPDPTITAALADRPFSAKEAGVGTVACRVELGDTGVLILHAALDLPSAGGTEYVVVEAGNPHVWVAEPSSRRKGKTLHSSTQLMHVDGKSFALNRSNLRFTVIGDDHAVDIQGCSS